MGTVRRECLDWILIASRRHLQHVLAEFIGHYNGHRPHRALGLAPPEPHPPAPPVPTPPATSVHRHDRLGGLIHEYTIAAQNHARSNKGTPQAYHRHPQPAQAPHAPDSDRRGLRGPRKAPGPTRCPVPKTTTPAGSAKRTTNARAAVRRNLCETATRQSGCARRRWPAQPPASRRQKARSIGRDLQTTRSRPLPRVDGKERILRFESVGGL